MLVSLVMLLEARSGGMLPGTTGLLTYSAVLDAVALRNPGLAARLHAAGEDKKPFTVSELGGPGRGGGRMHVKPSARFELRITSMDPELSEQLRSWADGPGSSLRVRGFGFDIEFGALEVKFDQEDHFAAGVASYEDLIARVSAPRLGAATMLKFRVRSPATFRLRGSPAVNLPFPLPRLVFKHLAGQWCAHAPAAPRTLVHEKLLELLRADDAASWHRLPWYVLDDSVLIARYELRTHMLAFRHQGENIRQVGFTGTFQYDLRHIAASAIPVLEVLADFAFFAGIGYRTTWGMGQGWRVAE